MLALCVSHSAVAANYALGNDNIALSFDDANSTVVVKDIRANHPLTPQELFFLTLPDETKIHTADFKIKHVEKQDSGTVIDFTHPDFNVTVKLNTVKGNTPASTTPLPPLASRETWRKLPSSRPKAGSGTLRRRGD